MSKTILTQEQEKEIIYKYSILGISKNKLKEEYRVSEGTIKRALIRNNIALRSIQETNKTKYEINHHFFNLKNQTADSNYILGLLASDGWVGAKDNCICIELQQEDRQILEDINQILKNSRPVKDYIRTNGFKNCKLYFFSKEIKNDLKEYDIIPNKTYQQLNFTKNIRFISSFIRGFFDGDGSITSANGGIRWQLDGTSKETFLSIQVFFKENYQIDLTLVETTDESCTIPRYRLYTYGREKCKKIFDILYEDANLKLNRKYNKFLELLK